MQVDSFSQRSYDTVYLAPPNPDDLRRVWSPIAKAFGYRGRPFVPHLTLGQADKTPESREFFRRQGSNLIASGLSWTVGSVVILRKDESDGGAMKIYAEIPFESRTRRPALTIAPTSRPVYHLGGDGWTPSSAQEVSASVQERLTVATYNVLHDEAFPIAPRLEPLVKAITSSKADILCLQEVSDELLQHLSAHADVRACFAWSTRGPDETMENERNIWVLSRRDVSFSWQNVTVNGKAKPVHVLSVNFGSSLLVLAAVHFTAGLTVDRIRRKEQEFRSLSEHLQSTYPDATDVIIVGDTNFPTSMSAPSTKDDSQWLDAWQEAHSSDDTPGNTYDPQANPVALRTSKEDKSPQRYDRLYLRAGGRLSVSSASLFGVNETGKSAPSDHYGLAVTLRYDTTHASNASTTTVQMKAARVPSASLSTREVSDKDLISLLEEHSLIPSEEDHKLKEKTVETLRSILTQVPLQPSTDAALERALEDSPSTAAFAVKLIVQPVGSFALGVDFPSSDVDCLVVGNISPTTFWALARQRIKQAQPVSRIKRFVKEAAVQMLELDVMGVKVDLQYCCAASLSER